jgi:ABC-2 type transport system permease protein
LYYFNKITYAIILKGAGFDILWESILGLAALGVFFFSFGVWRFRKQFG